MKNDFYIKVKDNFFLKLKHILPLNHETLLK
jgi:hypothetical protein